MQHLESKAPPQGHRHAAALLPVLDQLGGRLQERLGLGGGAEKPSLAHCADLRVRADQAFLGALAAEMQRRKHTHTHCEELSVSLGGAEYRRFRH